MNASFPEGLRLAPGRLARSDQEALLAEVFARVKSAPFYTPTLPGTGAAMSVRMTNFGPLGWVSDKQNGYRYQPLHPFTGRPWPDIPAVLARLWREMSGYPAEPEACVVNLYQGRARMGLHVDADEEAWDAPVLSISLGDTAVFRIGGRLRSDPTRSVRLASGDVLILGGSSRRAFHGVDRILPGSSSLIPQGGRINLTLRRVTPPDEGGVAGGLMREAPLAPVKGG